MALAASVRGVVTSGTTTSLKLIDTADSWAYLTVLASSAGARMSTSSAAVRANSFPIPTDAALTLLLPPGTTVYATGTAGTLIGVATQPVPWPARLWLLLDRWLGGAVGGGRMAA